MTRIRVLIAVLMLGLIGVGQFTVALAVPLQVSGSIVFDERFPGLPTAVPVFNINLAGPDGFTYVGRADVGLGVCNRCPYSDFSGGEQVGLVFAVPTPDLSGTWTYQGLSHNVRIFEVPNILVATSDNVINVPLPNIGTETFVVPAHLSGTFFADVADAVGTMFVAQGTGTLVLTGQQLSGVNRWVATNMRFDFPAIPEPSTWILLGSGLVWLIRHKFKTQRCGK